jgi:hypothetical protein
MPREVTLKPGWLREDTKRAAERIEEWSTARDERSVKAPGQDQQSQMSPSSSENQHK